MHVFGYTAKKCPKAGNNIIRKVIFVFMVEV